MMQQFVSVSRVFILVTLCYMDWFNTGIDLLGGWVSWGVHPLVVARSGEQISISNFYIGRGAPELGSGRNPDFLDFRFRPELVKKAWPEPELCRNRNSVTYDYIWLNKLVPVPAGTSSWTFFQFRSDLVPAGT
jgi:hypothetical protein